MEQQEVSGVDLLLVTNKEEFWSQSQSTNVLVLLPDSLSRSVPGGGDGAGAVREDRHALQHHGTADHQHLQTEGRRHPHPGL